MTRDVDYSYHRLCNVACQVSSTESKRAMNGGAGWQLLVLVRTLAIGPLFAQLLMLAASPVLARLYSPSEFGVVASFLLGGAAIGSIACLKLDNAIIRVSSSLEAVRIAKVAILSALSFAIVFSAFGFIVLTQLEHVEHMICLLYTSYVA